MNRLTLPCFLAVLIAAPVSSAHTRWATDSIAPPRSSNSNLKEGPCGNIPRTSTPTTFNIGETITLSWDETINHPGYFRIAFSMANDEGFDDNVLIESFLDTQGPEAPTPHRFSTSVTLPATTCTECTLQIIQVMTENPERPRNYYSCADIILTDPSSETPEPEPEPAPPETTLSTAEIALALLQDFTQLDLNTDNHLDSNEYGQAITDSQLTHFGLIDSDTNGLLSVAELHTLAGIEPEPEPEPPIAPEPENENETPIDNEPANDNESGSVFPLNTLALLLILLIRRKPHDI